MDAARGMTKDDDSKVADLDKVRQAKSRLKMTRASVAGGGLEKFERMVPGGAWKGIEPGQWRAKGDRFGLPEECPVKPLGRDGDVCYILNVFGSITELTTKSGRGDVRALFAGAKYFPSWAWPKKAKRGAEDFNYNVDLCLEDLVEAATRRQRELGLNVIDSVRGRGCWPAAEGGLYVHLGNRILGPDGSEIEPYANDDHVYPMRPPIDPPATGLPAAAAEDPGNRLLSKLMTWRWTRPDLDPFLLLGWIGAAFLGAALPWRPVAMVTGDIATGKSSLLALVKATLQKWAILTTNSTAPAIYRALNCDALAVINDEAEGKRDNRRAMAVIELAREAASGSMTMRAAGDGADKFTVRSAFMFGCVNMPPLEPADYSRMALLQLRPFETAGQSPLDEREDAANGAMILRRLIDRYADVVEAFRLFRAALVEVGHDGRGGDTFGILLACQFVIREDGLPTAADLSEWKAAAAPDRMNELEGKRANWEACLDQLLTAQPEVWKTYAAKSVGSLLARWRDNHDPTMTEAGIRERLSEVGLGLVFRQRSRLFQCASLFVPAAHPLTRILFRDTKWGGEAGAPGTFVTALRGAPEKVVAGEAAQQRIAGRHYSGVLINLSEVLEKEENHDGS